MLNIFTITKALYDQIAEDSAVVANGYRVEHEEYINMDPDRTPWIGVYKAPVKYLPETLGRHSQSWDAEIQLIVLVQASHGASGEKCGEELCQIEQDVLNAIWSDASFDGNVDMITDFNVEYSYNNREIDSMHFQQSIITITARVTTG